MTQNKKPNKLTTIIPICIFGFMAITLMIPQVNQQPTQDANAGQINESPGYQEMIQEGKQKQIDAKLQLESGQKLQQAGELLLEACKLTAENPEDCTTNDYDSLNQELEQLPATPEDKVSKKEKGLVTPTQATTSSDNWKEFTDFAKANPWRGPVFPDGNHLQIAKANMKRYEGIEGCHPYLLAAIHYSETGLQMNNGANGQGVFQHFSSPIRYPANSEVTDFKDQVTRACNHIRGKVGGADLSSLEDTNLIGIALALYNGCYSPGIRAYARGDYGTPRGWDKCPYTANFLTNKQGMKQCAVDGCRKHNTRSIYGTMAFIAHLKSN